MPNGYKEKRSCEKQNQITMKIINLQNPRQCNQKGQTQSPDWEEKRGHSRPVGPQEARSRPWAKEDEGSTLPKKFWLKGRPTK